MSDKLGDFLGLPGAPKKDKASSMLKSLSANVKDDRELGLSGEVMPAESPAAAPEPRPISVEKEQDFRKSRKDIDTVISTGMEALENLSSLALASEDTKAYDTVARMMQVLIAASEKRVKLHREKELPGEAPAGGTTTNNMFVGTTSDLLKLIKDKKE